MALPRDFLDELETELRRAQRALAQNREHIAALEELRRVAIAVEARLSRPITVFDVIRSTVDRAERERRASLVRQLRDREGASNQS